MTNFAKALCVAVLGTLFAMPVASQAATRDLKQDGSCGGTPVRQADRKKDGTGQSQAKTSSQRKSSSSSQGARKRDGSCK